MVIVAAVSVLPEGVDELRVGELYDGAADDFYGHRRGAVGYDAQAAEVVVVEVFVIHQHLQHGGDHHRAVNALFFHNPHPVARLELSLDGERSAAVDGAYHRLHPRYVVQRDGEYVALFHFRVGGRGRG